MEQKYIERTLGERKYKKMKLWWGAYTLLDGRTIQVKKPMEAWRVVEWGYEYPSSKTDLGWQVKGIALSNPNEPEHTAMVEAEFKTLVWAKYTLGTAVALATGLMISPWHAIWTVPILATTSLLTVRTVVRRHRQLPEARVHSDL